MLERDGKGFTVDLHVRQSALDFVQRTYGGGAERYSAAEETGIRTRLGDDRVRVPLPNDQVAFCRYAPEERLEFVELPEPLVVASGVSLASPTVTEWRTEEDGARCRLGSFDLWYDDDGWHWRRA